MYIFQRNIVRKVQMWDFCTGYIVIVGGGSLQIQIVLVGGCCLYFSTLLLFVEASGVLDFIYIISESTVCTDLSNSSMILVLLTLTYRKRPKNDSTKKIRTTYKVIVL